MKFSLKWLGGFIETASFFKEPKKLAEALIQAGLEVDSFEDQNTQFKKVVTAQIVSVEKHPQADRLTVCKVKTNQETYSVVCGAKNHKTGDKVILAQEGAVLPAGLKIKKSRIRGIASEAMLVSPSELGFPKEKEEGIWILPETAPLGQNFAEYKKLDDILFEITVPPNRSDCLSHKGLAREIGALFSIQEQYVETEFGLARKIDGASFSIPLKNTKPSSSFFGGQFLGLNGDSKLSIQQSLSVEVKDKKACPRYCATLIEGVEIKESPQWLKQRLESLGLKSINNVVDMTNFILWDQGQPLHAFDRDKIHNIEVALAQEGEVFLSLDNNELTLTAEDLTIRDKHEVLALAGVIGGMNSSITPETKNIVIEAACFAPERIRKSSRRLGIETDSSYRFARAVDPFSVFSSMELACHLIQKEAGGRIAKDFYDIHGLVEKKLSIPISLQDLSERLGYVVDSGRFEKWMKNIGCELPSYKGAFKVSPPSYRSDLKIKEDLIEEFARLEGYDNVPENPPPRVLPQTSSDKSFLSSQKWIQFLSSRFWLESCHYSFCDLDYYKDFLNLDESSVKDAGRVCDSDDYKAFLNEKSSPEEINVCDSDDYKAFLNSQFYLEGLLGEGNDEKSFFSINNPISRQLSLMKPLLTPDLFKSISKNFRKNNKFGQIFELAPIFYKKQDESYEQDLHLALGMWGAVVDIWVSEPIPHFYKMKSEIEALFRSSQIKGWFWEKGCLPFLHPKKTLILNFQKRKIGFLGNLHPGLTQKYKIPADIALAEFNLSCLLDFPKKPLKFKAFSNLLTVEKDLCFIVPLEIPVQKVKEEIQKTLSDVCQKTDIFNIYNKGDQRFVSFRMNLSPKKKTWTDKELRVILERAIQAVERKFSVKLK